MKRLLLPLAGLVLLAAAMPPAPRDDAARAKELLKAYAGTWDTETTFAAFPPSKGSEEVKLLAHGLSAVITATSTESMGPGMPPFEGHGLFGYDKAQNKWLHVWVDNTDTNFSVSEGTWSADGKTFTIEDTADMGAGPQKMLMITTITGADTRSFAMRPKDMPADAAPILTITYKRHAP